MTGRAKVTVLIGCTLLLAGCGTTTVERVGTGALIGAGLGASTGALFGNGLGVVPGTAIGAAIGAAAGALSGPPTPDDSSAPPAR